jgi:hypothetical protein
VLARAIDPAVVDEHDPTLSDRTLDMYAEENGFRPPPEPSGEPPFIDRVPRGAARSVRRLDALARSLLEPGNRAARRDGPGFDALLFSTRQTIERALHLRRVSGRLPHDGEPRLRGPAPRSSPREYGSLLSERPD